jgi:hypothetical protein
MPTAGAAAVQNSVQQKTLQQAETAPQVTAEQIKQIGDKAFILQNGIWTDTQFNPDKMTTRKIAFGSDAYFQFLAQYPDAARYLALGSRVIVVLDGIAYEITENETTYVPSAVKATNVPVSTPATNVVNTNRIAPDPASGDAPATTPARLSPLALGAGIVAGLILIGAVAVAVWVLRR